MLTVPRGGKMDWKPVREKIRSMESKFQCPRHRSDCDDLNIMGTTPCIEPNYKNLFVKSNLRGFHSAEQTTRPGSEEGRPLDPDMLDS